MKVVPLRQGSLGLQGTYKNAQHHAKPLIPLVTFLEKKVPKLGFPIWRQGHNVHVLETSDGRRFVLRPFSQKTKGYLGITLSAKISRSHEVHLVTLHVGQDDLSFGEFARILESLAKPTPYHEQLNSQDHEELAQAQ